MEREVFLVFEIGEIYLGTVGELLHPEDPNINCSSFNSGVVDIISEIAFNENHLGNSMALSIELREPRENPNGIRS
jgi:hypothetical protein